MDNVQKYSLADYDNDDSNCTYPLHSLESSFQEIEVSHGLSPRY